MVSHAWNDFQLFSGSYVYLLHLRFPERVLLEIKSELIQFVLCKFPVDESCSDSYMY